MKKTMILLLAAALLVGTTGCNRPGTASTDTSGLPQSRNSSIVTWNESTAESVCSEKDETSVTTGSSKLSSAPKNTNSKKSSSKASGAKKVSSKQTVSEEPLVIPPELQKFWDSLTDIISDEEIKAYKAYMDEKGYDYKGLEDKDIFQVAYGLDEKPYFVIAYGTNGNVVFDRYSKCRLDESGPATNESMVALINKNPHPRKRYKGQKIYFDGPFGEYIKKENGDYLHLGLNKNIPKETMKLQILQTGLKRLMVQYSNFVKK